MNHVEEGIIEGQKCIRYIYCPNQSHITRFRRSDLRNSNFENTDLHGVMFNMANLTHANLSKTNLIGASIIGADLRVADLSNANLTGANLTEVRFRDTNLEGANLSKCHIWGISVWNIKTNEFTIQTDLRVTKLDEPFVSVDNIEIAQFIYLMLNYKYVSNNVRNLLLVNTGDPF